METLQNMQEQLSLIVNFYISGRVMLRNTRVYHTQVIRRRHWIWIWLCPTQLFKRGLPQNNPSMLCYQLDTQCARSDYATCKIHLQSWSTCRIISITVCTDYINLWWILLLQNSLHVFINSPYTLLTMLAKCPPRTYFPTTQYAHDSIFLLLVAKEFARLRKLVRW